MATNTVASNRPHARGGEPHSPTIKAEKDWIVPTHVGVNRPTALPGEAAYEDIGEREAALLLKRAEVANIDVQIGIALDPIADWRRHRARLERKIAELEATARQPQEGHAG